MLFLLWFKSEIKFDGLRGVEFRIEVEQIYIL